MGGTNTLYLDTNVKYRRDEVGFDGSGSLVLLFFISKIGIKAPEVCVETR